jgi:two-component system nitrogen regulation response regulator NtrX
MRFIRYASRNENFVPVGGEPGCGAEPHVNMTSVLYLGCPASERQETERLLADASVSVIWAENVPFALNELQRRDMPVLLDLSRGAAALQIARELRSERAATLMFAVVDARRPDLTTEAVLAGMADVFARPLGGRRVANAIEREQRYESRQFGGGLETPGADLYSHSPAMRDVMVQVAKASTLRGGVLIRGEEGTGRQVTARVIHASSPNGPHPDKTPGAFVMIDCGAFDSASLDVHLFGDTARSLNGDNHGLERVSAEGQLYAAQNGTLYLQNVADASTRVQARLARLLRDREAILAETGAAIPFDVRPMAGVELGIDGAVQEGRVREDLFRRLSVICIDMPPLRQRREDIPALANYFLRDVCASLGLPPKTVSRPALSLISALPWRGNGVELRTFIESVVAGSPVGRSIGLEDVLAHVRLDGDSVVFSNGGTLRQARARFERDYIAAVLEQHHGRISDAARALGIQRTNLYRKIRSLRVSAGRRVRES